MGAGYENLQMDANFTEIEAQAPVGVILPQGVIGGAPINGITVGGSTLTGPTINIGSNAPGFGFTVVGNSLMFNVTNAATARATLGAAKSGTNGDITGFTALAGNAGVHPWTGTANGAAQSTYPATVASAAYVQAELQGVMTKVQQMSEFIMFLIIALSNPGLVKP